MCVQFSHLNVAFAQNFVFFAADPSMQNGNDVTYLGINTSLISMLDTATMYVTFLGKQQTSVNIC